MLFSSISFLYYFLPMVFIVYFAVPQRLKNGVLLGASLFFYAWGEPRYVLLMMIVIVAGYCSGLFLMHLSKKAYKKIVLILSLSFNIGLFVYFKYADFFIANWNQITGQKVSLLKIALPIGISFYMFQMISYLLDVYHGKVKGQKNLLHLALYISMFPQLIAGPIVRYEIIERQLTKREHTIARFSLGMRGFTMGLAKKVLIANSLGELCNQFEMSEDKSILYFWLAAVAFTLHIYFDFSGYSDMAIGLGKIFGFDFPQNFNYPYTAVSITDFWRRWHMTLGSWFRDYVYIPLGGNRVSKSGWIRNVLLVWMITGFWHGASWNFIIWGAYFAVLLLMEKLWLCKYMKTVHWWNHIYVLILVVIGFVIFNADNMAEAELYMKGLTGIGGYAVCSAEFIYYLKSYGVVLAVAMIGATPVPKCLIQKIQRKEIGAKLVDMLEPMILLGLFLVITGYLIDGSYNPFLYFRF